MMSQRWNWNEMQNKHNICKIRIKMGIQMKDKGGMEVLIRTKSNKTQDENIHSDEK